jgi:serine/threonine protein kinase
MQKDRYELLGPLGFGATSRVDKARDKIIGRTVAIKTLVHSFGAAPQQKQFLREAQIVGQLSHPAIVSLFDVGIEETGLAYLVMEYINGQTLQQLLAESPVPWPRACAWAADLAHALGRAHQAGIIHGDVKPANIMVTEDGHVKLSDFGIARFATQVSGSGRIMGTPAYLAPEQILGEPHSAKSDLFSIGIVLYQMLTGVPPFDGSSVAAVCAQILTTQPIPPSKRNPALPAGLDHIVMRCLAKEAADRYPSCEALAASLYPLARQTPGPSALPSPKVSWWSRPIQTRDIWVFASILLVTAIGVPVGRAVVHRFHQPQPPMIAVDAPKPPQELFTAGFGEPLTISSASLSPAPAPKTTPRNKSAAHSGSAKTRAALPIDPEDSDDIAPQPRRERRANLGRAVAPVGRNPHVELAAGPAFANGINGMIASNVGARVGLRIQIDTKISDGTLAVFADKDLLLTTPMHVAADLEEPIELKNALSAGPHQLRVVLYRSDKSLQTEKEGLGEIRGDGENLLTIKVSRRSKMLLKHQTALDVIWPSAIAPVAQDGKSGGTPLAASLK